MPLHFSNISQLSDPPKSIQTLTENRTFVKESIIHSKELRKLALNIDKGAEVMTALTCWLSWYDGGGTLWVAIIFTASAEDTCCIMGQLHIETWKDKKRERETWIQNQEVIVNSITAAATRCCYDYIIRDRMFTQNCTLPFAHLFFLSLFLFTNSFLCSTSLISPLHVRHRADGRAKMMY